MNWCEQISKCCLYINARLKTIDSSWWTLGINWFDSFPDTVLSLSSSRKLASLHGGMKFVENSVVLGAKSNTWSKKHKWKFKIIFSLYLSFFVIFLFVCLLLLFFTFIFSFSSDIRFKRTLSLVYSRHEGGNLSSGNKLHVTVSWMRYVHLCHYTTHIQKYNETLTNCNKSNQISVRLPYFLADTPLLRLYTQSLALFVLKPESRTWRRYFQKCIEKSFFVSHFFFRAFKLDLQYNWSNDLYHLWM